MIGGFEFLQHPSGNVFAFLKPGSGEDATHYHARVEMPWLGTGPSSGARCRPDQATTSHLLM